MLKEKKLVKLNILTLNALLIKLICVEDFNLQHDFIVHNATTWNNIMKAGNLLNGRPIGNFEKKTLINAS